MSTHFLACYLGGLLGITGILFSLITVAPDSALHRTIVQGVCFTGAVLFAALALACDELSSQHWINRSGVLRGGLFAAATTLTLLLLLGVIG